MTPSRVGDSPPKNPAGQRFPLGQKHQRTQMSSVMKISHFSQTWWDTFVPLKSFNGLFLLLLSSSQVNFVDSLLLMRTSSSRSLAFTCLYSLYSTAKGERSSFCTFLREPDDKHSEKRGGGGSPGQIKLIMSSPLVLMQSFTFHFV